MPRLAYCITSALLLGGVTLPHADAASSHANARDHSRANTTAAFAGAHNRASPTDRPQSNTDMRQQCYEQAAKQASSSNQDLQTVRDYAYRNCAYDHGLPP
jgi:hypothetical protein